MCIPFRYRFPVLYLAVVGFDCTVTNSKSNKTLAKPKVAKDCRDDSTQCVKGAKQGLWWQGAQKEGWNIPDTSEPNLPMVSKHKQACLYKQR